MVWKWVRWLLPSPTPRLEDHVSIWSIRARAAGTFFRLFAMAVVDSRRAVACRVGAHQL